MISSKNTELLQEYTNKFFRLLEVYYHINMLTLDQEKSKFMITCKGSIHNKVNNIKLRTSNYVINQLVKVEILGVFISSSLSNIHTVNNIVSKVNNRLHTLKKILRYTDLRTSKMIANAIIISIFKYSCPILINSETILINKLNTLLMKCTRPLLGFQSFKWNTTTIMKKLGWVTVHQMIFIETVNFLHKCIFEGKPATINELIIFSLNREQNVRSIRKPLLRDQFNSAKACQSIIPRAIFLYNKLPDDFRTYNCNKFKKQ